MEPSPRHVAETVADVLAARWPANEAQRSAWFDRLGLSPAVPLEGFRRWGTGLPGWGNTTTCWGVSGDNVTGISLFLWEEYPFEQRALARDALEAELRDSLGEPTLRPVPGHAGWLEWNCGELVVELSSGSPLSRRIQVHVVHSGHTEEFEERTCADDLPPRVNGFRKHHVPA
ncbi:MAG: hypothetical protein ACK5LS_06210 [Propioniciclava sp.]